MYGGTQARLSEVVPRAEADDLLRLALVVGTAQLVDLGDYGSRQTLQHLFTALESVENAGRRLRDIVLRRLVELLADRPAAYSDLLDLAQVAGVSPTHLQRVITSLSAEAPAHRPAVDPDD